MCGIAVVSSLAHSRLGAWAGDISDVAMPLVTFLPIWADVLRYHFADEAVGAQFLVD